MNIQDHKDNPAAWKGSFIADQEILHMRRPGNFWADPQTFYFPTYSDYILRRTAYSHAKHRLGLYEYKSFHFIQIGTNSIAPVNIDALN